MTPDALYAAITNHEDNFVERKPAGVNRAEIRKTLVAFANSVPNERTAVLFIGVRDDGTIDPVASTDAVQKTVNDICSRDCFPPIGFRGTVLTPPAGAVVAIEVDASLGRPHFSGPAYVRRGSQSEVASPELFREMVEAINGKVAGLRRMQNEMITIVSLQHRLGDDRPVVGAGYRESTEGQILAVDAHNVRLLLTSGLNVTEALGRVEISRDDAKHRSKIIVRG